MSTLNIDENLLRSLYKTADKAGKAELESKYGKDLFHPAGWRMIDSYEAACKKLKKDPKAELAYKTPKTNRQKAANAWVMLDIIAEALLDGVVIDWENGDQAKWFPWFTDYKSGAGFRFHGSDGWWTLTGAYGGARLALDTKEKSDYFGSHPAFLKIWNEFLNPKK